MSTDQNWFFACTRYSVHQSPCLRIRLLSFCLFVNFLRIYQARPANVLVRLPFRLGFNMTRPLIEKDLVGWHSCPAFYLRKEQVAFTVWAEHDSKILLH